MSRAALWISLLTLGACDSSIAADEGLDAWMRIDGAQFIRGAMPDGAGPTVASIDLATNAIRAGQLGKPIGGSLAPGARGVALMLDGDRGYWTLGAGTPDIASPTYPSFHASASFSRDLPGGDHRLIARAVDERGQFGPLSDDVLHALSDGVPSGALVISLTWDTNADLDLHVVDPSGVEIFARDITSSSGTLDFDSNAACVIDGVRREDVIWASSAPSGHYVARVDAFSLCGEVDANWDVRIYQSNKVIAEARGTCVDSDTRQAHDRGAGLTALEVDLP